MNSLYPDYCIPDAEEVAGFSNQKRVGVCKMCLFMVIMVLLGVCTVAVYLRMVHQYMLTSSEYVYGAYNEELVHASGATAATLLALSLCPLIFVGALVWQVCNLAVTTLWMQLLRIKGWCWAVGLAVVVFIWFSIINGGLPRLEDDLAYIFQAKLFSHGMRSLPMEALGSFKEQFYWWWTSTNGSHLYSFQIPGHSLMLSLGAFVNNFSLICVIEAAITCLATYQAAILLYGKRVATIAGLLFVTSPFVIATFSSYSASCSVASWVAVTMWAWAVFRRDPSIIRSLLLGTSLGITFWMRPTSSLFIGIPILINLLVRVQKKSARYRNLWAILFCFLVLCAGYVYYCSSLTGHLSLSPGDVYSRRLASDEMSVKHLLTIHSGHALGMSGFLYSLIALNFYLHGWPISLFFLIAYLVVHPKTGIDWVLVASITMMFCFYCGWRDILEWYYFELIPVLMLLSSQSIIGLYDQCRRRLSEKQINPKIVMAIMISGVFTSMCFSIPLILTKQHIYIKNYNWVDKAVSQSIKTQKALVFLGGIMESQLDKHLLSRNDPFLKGNIIYMMDDYNIQDYEKLSSLVGYREMYMLEVPQEGREILLNPLKNRHLEPDKK